MFRIVLRGSLSVLLSSLGAWAGLLIAALFFAKPEAERQRAENPGQFICGNQFFPVMFIGAAAGFGAGLWAGWYIGRRYVPDIELEHNNTNDQRHADAKH